MNWLDMPPLAALRAFSAFAETGNVVQAGQALNVSHAAISQQLRALERHLGVALLDRSGRALALTDQGRQLARALDLGFGAIGAAVRDLTEADGARPVHVSLTASFAASWLMPRLPGFRADHPGIDLVLDPSPDLVEFRPGGVDLAIRYGNGTWPGVEARMLLPTPMIVVAAPALLDGRTSLTPDEMAALPWLEELGTTEATTWLADRGTAPAGGRIQLPGNLLLDGLRAGQGITVTVRHFVEREVESGALIELYRDPGKSGYHLVTGPAPLRPAARTFVAWLRKQARDG